MQGLNEAWTVAIESGGFDAATSDGFQANFEYIEGANEPKTKIPMTSPVLARPHNTSDTQWQISFFVPTSLYPTFGSIPSPTGAVTIESVPTTGVRVATSYFPGFATHADFLATEAALRVALAAANVPVVDANSGAPFARVYAQYDSPFTLFNRHNEVWLQLA